MDQWDPRTIHHLVCEWARYALTQQAQLSIEVKPDDSLVTHVDREIERRAHESLTSNHCQLIGEETVKAQSPEYLEKALAGTCFILDPIDGTVPFSSLQPLWGISLAFARQGTIEAGCIVLPATLEVLITSGNDVLYGKGTTDLPDFDQLRPLSSPQVLTHAQAPGRMVTIAQRIFAKRDLSGFRQPIGSYYSCVYPLAYLALGRLRAMLFHLHAWDFAAGMAILSRLGFDISFDDGTPASLNLQESFDFSRTSSGSLMSKRPMIFAPSTDVRDAILNALPTRSS